MKNNPNEFYTEFDDNDSESNEPIPQEQKQNKDLAFIQTKKELFLTALLTLPFSASIVYILIIYILAPNISAIEIGIKYAVEQILFPLSFFFGLIISYIIVRKLTDIGGSQKVIINKHIIFFNACNIGCIISSLLPKDYIVLPALFIAIGAVIWSFRIFNKFEKKLFIPFMIFTVIASLFFHFQFSTPYIPVFY